LLKLTLPLAIRVRTWANPACAQTAPKSSIGQFAGAAHIHPSQEGNVSGHGNDLWELVRSRGIEPPRAKPTAPSTLRVYLFRHDRMGCSRVRPGYGSKHAPRQGRVLGRAPLANLA